MKSRKTVMSKPELPMAETQYILDHLKWRINMTNNREAGNKDFNMEYISEKSKEYYIPVSITHRLMEISHLHNEGPKLGEKLQTDQEIKKVLQFAGIFLNQWTEKEASDLIQHIRSQDWTYNEQQRAFVIITLGEIGQRQMLPPNVIRHLRYLMFKAKNPHVRLAVVHTFGKISILHPPDQQMLKQIAEHIKQYREESSKPPRVFTRALEYELFYKALEIIAQKRFFPIKLIQELATPLSNSDDDLKRMEFLQNTLLPIAQNRWPKSTIIYMEQRIPFRHSLQNQNQKSPQKESFNLQCRFSFLNQPN
ncbi:MAG: HEAT repeat domain-containing protein [Oligoflexia bacterium]|nr:HEAT repeat domain-containing protein [Oligoflexia bacterium]